MVEPAQDIPSYLRRHRRTAGFDQAELAQVLGVGRTAVVNWENGHTLPDLERVPQIAAALGLDPSVLEQHVRNALKDRFSQRVEASPSSVKSAKVAEVLKSRFESLESAVQRLRDELVDLRDQEASLRSDLDAHISHHP